MYTDQELVNKAAGLREEQDKWNDVFATKLIELLDKIDDIKSEINRELKRAQQAGIAVTEVEGARLSLAQFQDQIPQLHLSLEVQLAEVEMLRSEVRIVLTDISRCKDASVRVQQQLETALHERTIALNELRSAKDMQQSSREMLNKASGIFEISQKELRVANAKLGEAAEKLRWAVVKEKNSDVAYRAATLRLRNIYRLSIETVSVITFSLVTTQIVLLLRPHLTSIIMSCSILICCIAIVSFVVRLQREGGDREA